MIGKATAVLVFGMWSVCAASQAPVLGPDSERGFLRLMQMAQTGAFGPDVVNANIGITGTSVNVELVRASPPNQFFVLTSKTRAEGASRYFDIEGREGTPPADVARLARAIDQAFDASPFQSLSDDRRSAPSDDDRPVPPQPSMASKRYTIAVTLGVGAALAGGLLLLWGSTPPHPPDRFGE